MEYIEYGLWVIGVFLVSELFHPWCLFGIIMSVIGFNWFKKECNHE